MPGNAIHYIFIHSAVNSPKTGNYVMHNVNVAYNSPQSIDNAVFVK